MHMSAARGWSVKTRAGDFRVACPAKLHLLSRGTASLSMILTTCKGQMFLGNTMQECHCSDMRHFHTEYNFIMTNRLVTLQKAIPAGPGSRPLTTQYAVNNLMEGKQRLYAEQLPNLM